MSISQNPYEKTVWINRVYDIDDNGNLIPEVDAQGNQIIDPLTGQVQYKTIFDGTRFSAKAANNIEEGIYLAHEQIIELKKDNQRMRIQMEIDGRIPGNSGAFFDTLDGYSNKITLLKAKAEVAASVSKDATTIPVTSTEGFSSFTQVLVYDDVSSEEITITAVQEGSFKVQGLKNSYKKGAIVSRSNVEMDTKTGKMKIGDWGTYTVTVSEVS